MVFLKCTKFLIDICLDKGNISSALDALLGKKDCVPSAAPTNDLLIMSITRKLLVQGKMQNKSLSTQVSTNPPSQMLILEMGSVPSLEATWGRSDREQTQQGPDSILGHHQGQEGAVPKNHWDAKGMAWSWEDEFSCMCPGEHTDQQDTCHSDAVLPARAGPNSASAVLLSAKLHHTQGLPETDLNLVTERALSIITRSVLVDCFSTLLEMRIWPQHLGILAETDDGCCTCDSTTKYQ